MIQIADGFEYKGNKPLDSRLKYATITEMVAVPVANLYDGCEAYVTATKKYYSYDSTNEVDETLGKWRERQSGGGGTSDYSALSNKPQIEGVTLSGNKTASDLGLAKLTDLVDFITKSVDDLVNYYTKSQSYSKTEVDAIVTAIKNSRFEVVATLPTSDIKTNVIYLVPKADAESGDIKDEYINLDGTTAGWEKIGSTEVDLSNYVSEDDLNTALADYTTTTDLTTLLNGKQDVFQKYSMPTATEELVGTMYQYMGATNATYTHGYWYECIVGTEPNTYMWHQTSVQPASSLTVEDAEGTDLTQRDTMQFGEGFKVTDDSENEKTKVDLDRLATGELDDIFDNLPSVNKSVLPVIRDERSVERLVGKTVDENGVEHNVYEINKRQTFSNITTFPYNCNVELPLPDDYEIVDLECYPVYGNNKGSTKHQWNGADYYMSWYFNRKVFNYTHRITNISDITLYCTIRFIKTSETV